MGVGALGRFFLVRGFECVLVVLAVVSVVFFVTRVIADPITILAPVNAPPEEIERIKDQEGLNDPLLQQYWRFVSNAVRLDFGISFRTNRAALDEVGSRVPKTLQLGAAAIVLSVLVGLPVGVLSAAKRGTLIDFVGRLLALFGQAVPSFWLGLILIVFFSVELGWLPTGGTGGWKHLVLPSVTLASSAMASIMRLTRSAMLEVLNQDYIRTARAKGLSERTVLRSHALRNALIPVITIVGIQVGRVIAGAVIVETVFAWPGVGRLMIQSIQSSDYPVVQVGVLFISASIVGANAVVDLTYQMVDPRIRTGGR